MPFDRFLIAPEVTGMQQNVRPWLINDDAWTTLTNCYAFRGRIRKRFGSVLMSPTPNYSRFGVLVGTTDGAGNIAGTIPGTVIAGRIGMQFQIGVEIFTVYQAGAPAVMLDTGAATVKTFNTTNGAYVINGAAALTAVYFYPSLPVMGLTIWEKGVFNNQASFGFDTQFAYTWNGVQWLRSTAGVPPVWHGTDLNFFWVTNWTGITDAIPVLFVANFYAVNLNGPGNATDDSLWSFNANGGQFWAPFIPFFAPNGGLASSGPFVLNCKIIIPFQNRLLLLNTIENDNAGGLGTNTNYTARCRYSAYGSVFATTAWYERGQTDAAGNTYSGGGFIDASTDEQIISAEFIKNRLIVFFERSTWELAYTGNAITPFTWQKINTELGSESTFSTIPHDRYILTMATTGVHSCNGQNVVRIDDKIPDIIFSFQQRNDAPQRTYGIRDYYVECDYWAFAGDSNTPSYERFPNFVLVYNYKNGAWAFNIDCITAFGYFDQLPSQIWSSITVQTWEQSGEQWDFNTNVQNERQIIAGNPEGFVFIIEADTTTNARNLQITNIAAVGNNTVVTIMDHTFQEPDYILIENAQGVNGINDTIYVVEPIDANTANLFRIVLQNGEYVPIPAPFTGVYTGGGIAQRVSNIFMQSKQWNPYAKNSRNVFVERIDFCVLSTTAGEISVDYFASSSPLPMVQQGLATGSQLGTSILETRPYDPLYYPLEQTQVRLWHPIYFQSDGEFIQIQLAWNFGQITSQPIAFSKFELEGLVLHTLPTTDRLS